MPQSWWSAPRTRASVSTEFLKGAKKSLWIYDPKISDSAMVRLLEERVQKGVDVRVLGTVGKRAKQFRADRMKSLRLHARVIIRDGRDVFFGSQSLRTVELDGRREVGLIVRDAKLVKTVVATFEKDWADTKVAKVEAKVEAKRTPRPPLARQRQPGLSAATAVYGLSCRVVRVGCHARDAPVPPPTG